MGKPEDHMVGSKAGDADSHVPDHSGTRRGRIIPMGSFGIYAHVARAHRLFP